MGRLGRGCVEERDIYFEDQNKIKSRELRLLKSIPETYITFLWRYYHSPPGFPCRNLIQFASTLLALMLHKCSRENSHRSINNINIKDTVKTRNFQNRTPSIIKAWWTSGKEKRLNASPSLSSSTGYKRWQYSKVKY